MLADTLLHDAVTALPGSAATAVVWRSQGRVQITVIAKATFAFAQGGDMARVEAQPFVREEAHFGKNPARSVRLTSELVPHLARAEVVFTGHAHPPPGSRPTTAEARLGIFSGSRAILDKTVRIRDDDGFERMPMVYERAFGGLDFPDNPVGTGAGAETAEPNLVHPEDPRRPAGFAPIGRAWPNRKRLLQSTPRKVLERSVAEIPDGFDWSYFQAAPADQRVDGLRGDEWIVMDGLHPTLPRAQMRLPSARGLARVYGLSAFGWTEGHPIALTADTLRIDGDEQRCTVVWRSSFPVAGEGALTAVRIVAGMEIAGETLAWPATFAELSSAKGADAGAAQEAPRTAFLMPEAAPAVEDQAATPFVAGAAAEAVARSAGAARRTQDTGTVAVGMAGALPATLVLSGLATVAFVPEAPEATTGPTLPFQPASTTPSPLAQPGPGAGRRDRDFSGTLALPSDEEERPAALQVLPFAPEGGAAPKAAPPPPVETPAPIPELPILSPPPEPEAPAPAALAPALPSPWAPAPEAAPPPAPRPPPPPKPTPPAASPALKRGLYGRFGR
jgi:hypothetical protein